MIHDVIERLRYGFELWRLGLPLLRFIGQRQSDING
jgi:hypothetical protein